MQFYYFVDGERKGPIGTSQLKTLAALGKIAKETEIELENGRRILARKVKGLTFKGETPKTKTEEATDAGEIYGVAEPVAPPPIVAPEPSVPENIGDITPEVWGASSEAVLADEPPVAPPSLVSVPAQVPAPQAPPSKRGARTASVVLFALSGVFLAAALVAACVGFAQSRKAESAANAANYASSATPGEAPNDARLDELERKRKSRAEFLEKYDLEKTEYGTVRGTEMELLAYEAATNWQKAALADARRRPSASAEAYMAALDRLNFDRHEFVGGDAYNCEVNASLFTGLGVLGVGNDVRDVGEKIKTVETNLRAVGTDVQAVRSEVRSASAVIAAGAGFVCAALLASTSALLLALGLLARRTSAV